MNEVKKQASQIDEQSEFLEKSIAQLVETIEVLEGRLTRLIRDIEPRETKEGVEANLVPFANFLRGQAWAVQIAKNKINSILERLEL